MFQEGPLPKLFISVLEGETPASATPILASGDPRLIRAVLKAIVRVLGPEAPRRVLKLDRDDRSGQPEDTA